MTYTDEQRQADEAFERLEREHPEHLRHTIPAALLRLLDAARADASAEAQDNARLRIELADAKEALDAARASHARDIARATAYLDGELAKARADLLTVAKPPVGSVWEKPGHKTFRVTQHDPAGEHWATGEGPWNWRTALDADWCCTTSVAELERDGWRRIDAPATAQRRPVCDCKGCAFDREHKAPASEAAADAKALLGVVRDSVTKLAAEQGATFARPASGAAGGDYDEGWALGLLSDMAERWDREKAWHAENNGGKPFHDGTIHVLTRELHAASILMAAERASVDQPPPPQPRMSDADVGRVLDSLRARVRLLEDGATSLTERVDELAKGDGHE